MLRCNFRFQISPMILSPLPFASPEVSPGAHVSAPVCPPRLLCIPQKAVMVPAGLVCKEKETSVLGSRITYVLSRAFMLPLEDLQMRPLKQSGNT